MDPNTFPTKGNLMLAKNSLDLAKMGYDLMDKKRNILIREIMDLIEKAKDIQAQIDTTFREAYAALQTANIENGIDYVQTISYTVPLEESRPDQDPEHHGRRDPAGGGRSLRNGAHVRFLYHQQNPWTRQGLPLQK